MIPLHPRSWWRTRWSGLLIAVAVAIGAAALLSACETPNHTLTVTTAADGPDADPGDGVCEMTADAGDCSLRAAVDESNASTAVELITIAPGIDPVLTLPDVGDDEDNIGGDLDLTDGATIDGNGATIDGGGLDRVLHFQTDEASDTTWYTLRNATVTGGDIADGAGVFVGDLTSVTIEATTITGNTTPGVAAGLYVEADGVASVTNSTISGNSLSSEWGYAAAVFARGQTSIRYSTIADNESAYVSVMRDSIGSSGPLTVTASIIDAPPGDVACDGAIQSGGANVVSDTSCGFAAPGDQEEADPLLGPLQDNGGLTHTHLPGAGSPAVDAIGAGTAGCGTSDTRDQRTTPRPQGSGCDIGAVERQ